MIEARTEVYETQDAISFAYNSFKILPSQEVRYGVSRGDGENTTVGRGISWKKLWHFRLGALAD